MQKISRRALFAGAAGLAAATQLPRQAWAPPALHGIQACKFNQTLLQNNTGAIPGMITSPTVTIAFAFRSTQVFLNTATIVQTAPPGTANWANFSFTNDGSGVKLQGFLSGPTGPNSFTAMSPILPSAFNGEYHWIAMTLDAAGNWARLAFDGTPMTPITQTFGSGVAGNWNMPILIGGSGISGKNVSAPYNGDLAQLQVLVGGGQIDVSDPAVIAALYDVTNEEPVIIGTRGYIGPPIDQQAQIHMDGPPPMFKRNNAGYPYDWDATNSPFQVIKGSLTQSTLDPWGFAGE